MTNKLEEKTEQKVVDLCTNIAVPPHNLKLTAVGVFLINPDGSTLQIGEAETCGAQGYEEKKSNRWDCWRYPNMLWKSKDFPYHQIRREDVGKPSYWTTWGWHFCKMPDGRYLNYNNLGPDFFDFEKLKPEHKRVVTFVRNHPLSDFDD
jgi:hypothetical protein